MIIKITVMVNSKHANLSNSLNTIDFSLGYSGNSLGSGSYTGRNYDQRASQSSSTGVEVTGITNDYRHGSETRPRNMHVSFIMRVW